MSEPVPVLHYSFDSYVSGTTVPNDGSSGSALNGTLTTLGTGSATIVSSNAAVGMKCLSLIGGSTSNGGHISVPAFTFGGAGWSVCFWYKKMPALKMKLLLVCSISVLQRTASVYISLHPQVIYIIIKSIVIGARCQ